MPKTFEITETIRRVVARCVEQRIWRSECEREALAYLPRTEGRAARDAVKEYIRERYDVAGAGFSGRWQ